MLTNLPILYDLTMVLRLFSMCLNNVLNVRALVGIFSQRKGPFL